MIKKAGISYEKSTGLAAGDGIISLGVWGIYSHSSYDDDLSSTAFDLLVLILSSGYLMKKRILIRILSITAIISLLVLLFIHVLNNKVPFIPFKDYLAFIGITIPIILFLLFNKSDMLSLSAYLLAGLVIVYCSGNRTGIIIVSLVWPLAFLYLSMTDYSRLTHRIIPSLIAIFIPLIITILISYGNQNIAPSIWSRGLLNNIVFNTNLDIDEFIVGRGWGSFTDELIKSATTMDISLHNMFNSNRPVWDALTRLDFHSHNFIAEAFNSIGIFGLMAVLLFPAFLIMFCRRELLTLVIPFSLAYSTISSTWFQLVICLPFIGLAIGCQAVFSEKNERKRLKCLPDLTGFLLLIFALSGAASSFFIINISQEASKILMENQYKTRSTAESNCNLLRNDGRGGEYLGLVAYSYYLSNIKEKNTDQPVSKSMSDLYCSIENEIEQNGSIQLLTSAILLCGDALTTYNHNTQNLFVKKCSNDMNHYLDLIFEHTNYRSDLFAPYFYWLLNTQQDNYLQDETRKILLKQENDPVALWFLGISLLNEEDNVDKGLEYMRMALDKGVERLIPIEKDWVIQLNKH